MAVDTSSYQWDMIEILRDTDRVEELSAAFVWDDTPQGHKFWESYSSYTTLSKKKAPDEAYYEALDWLLLLRRDDAPTK